MTMYAQLHKTALELVEDIYDTYRPEDEDEGEDR